MKIGVPRQHEAGETRVALTPAVVKRLLGQGAEVMVESGAGVVAHASDEDYREVGASVVPGEQALPRLWGEADAVITIQPPTAEQVGALRGGAVVMGMLAPLANQQMIRALADRGATAISMEFIPRISRAQSMDVLSSQANIGGYKAVIMAADRCPKMFPMMITAAGTLAPSRVFVIGAGVAGLQAIATAKRLGAVVEAYDIRPAVKEQVQSLGARFVELAVEAADAETSGGYAREQTEEQRRKQAALMSKHVISADAVITTAAVFGKAPPMLIPADTVHQMAAGSVLVDLAADPHAGRGNCELTRPGETFTTDGGVTVIGTLNLPALVPVHASHAYANNMHALLKGLIVDGQLKIDLDDEVQKGAVIVHDGRITNDMIRQATSQ